MSSISPRPALAPAPTHGSTRTETPPSLSRQASGEADVWARLPAHVRDGAHNLRTAAQNVQDALSCPISLELLQDPVAATPCGHLFSAASATGMGACALCRTHVEHVVAAATVGAAVGSFLSFLGEESDEAEELPLASFMRAIADGHVIVPDRSRARQEIPRAPVVVLRGREAVLDAEMLDASTAPLAVLEEAACLRRDDGTYPLAERVFAVIAQRSDLAAADVANIFRPFVWHPDVNLMRQAWRTIQLHCVHVGRPALISTLLRDANPHVPHDATLGKIACELLHLFPGRIGETTVGKLAEIVIHAPGLRPLDIWSIPAAYDKIIDWKNVFLMTERKRPAARDELLARTQPYFRIGFRVSLTYVGPKRGGLTRDNLKRFRDAEIRRFNER